MVRMSASSRPRSNSFAAADAVPHGLRLCGYLPGSDLCLYQTSWALRWELPWFCWRSLLFSAGSIARESLRYIVLPGSHLRPQAGNTLKDAYQWVHEAGPCSQHSPPRPNPALQPDRSRERWLRLAPSFLQCFWSQRYFACPRAAMAKPRALSGLFGFLGAAMGLSR